MANPVTINFYGEKVFDSETSARYEFELLNNGHISCKTCPKTSLWCTHTQQALIEGWDAFAVWSDRWPKGQPERLKLSIPMFPSASLWDKVYLDRIKDKDRFIVGWHPPGSNPEAQEPAFLLVLNPGEGRQVIRTSLIDFMMSDSQRTLSCLAPHHNIAAQIEWERDQKTSLFWPQTWSVYTTGHCIPCQVQTDQLGDTVPDVEKSGAF